MIIGKCPVCGEDMRIGSDMTNADRIRSMTDAELARWLNKMQGYAFNCGLLESMIRDYPNRLEKWLAWLKEEVKNV